MSKRSQISTEESLLAQTHPRRAVTIRTPESFRRVGIYHIISGNLAISCQLAVTLLVCYDVDQLIFAKESTSASRNISKASVGIIAGVVYWLLGAYGLYMGQHLYAFRFEVLTERLWFFNVLNGLSIMASAALFGASSYIAKSSAVWYLEDGPSPAKSLIVLIMSVLLIMVSCFEVCVGTAGVFMK